MCGYVCGQELHIRGWLAMRDYDTRSQRGQPFFEENGIPDWYQNTILFVWLLIATSISLFNLDHMKMKEGMTILKSWEIIRLFSGQTIKRQVRENI